MIKSLRSLFAVAVSAALFLSVALPSPALAAETTLTVAGVTSSGVTSAPASANADGSKFLCPADGRTFLRVKNASGGAIVVTVEAQQASVNAPGIGTVTVPDITVSVPATTGDKLIGPFGAAYIDSSGYCHVTYASVTSLTVEAYYLTPVR
ncbi:MAG: hypothetical protein NW206_19880 [Hyphomonadaceae bacterium]|nr:hypothetical protein [Hyphomonadaceae bacterium]